MMVGKDDGIYRTESARLPAAPPIVAERLRPCASISDAPTRASPRANQNRTQLICLRPARPSGVPGATILVPIFAYSCRRREIAKDRQHSK